MTRDELKSKIQSLAKTAYDGRSKAESFAVEYDELTKFPELKQVIIDLLTTDFDSFISSIDWVSPRPTTFRINLKNGFNFYLTYVKLGWAAQVEGKRYFLTNLPEEERAASAISRILKYGDKENLEADEGGNVDFPQEEAPTEETSTEEPEV